jgi:hypothetical protein
VRSPKTTDKTALAIAHKLEKYKIHHEKNYPNFPPCPAGLAGSVYVCVPVEKIEAEKG